MTERVYPFLNLTLPENDVYTNDEYGIRIEPIEGANEFEENRRELDSEYRSGYWHTANVYIDQPKDEADKIANALSMILSFTLSRDVTFNGRFPENTEDAPFLRMSTATFDIDNTNNPLVKGLITGKPNPGVKLGPFLDVVLDEVLPLSEAERKDKLSPISQFLEAKASVFASTEFLLMWVAVESCANENYESYKESVGDLFNEEERQRIQDIVIETAEQEFDEKKVDFLERRFRQNYLYEYGIDLKIKIFLEYLDIGFDMDEIEEIVKESKKIRNLVVHEADSGKLINEELNRLGELRKILIYIILRRIGVDKKMQERLVTPMFPGPEIS
ncbi:MULTISPECIES: hypothetical protein [Haloarcula]|uniref:hypothetical protein n=1 Tax=Haloarcula TaxID=2237 RepID=UPI0023E8C043|nr:hypothetical protein [Halomicroarcula sp. SHR3]